MHELRLENGTVGNVAAIENKTADVGIVKKVRDRHFQMTLAAVEALPHVLNRLHPHRRKGNHVEGNFKNLALIGEQELTYRSAHHFFGMSVTNTRHEDSLW